MMTNPKEEMTKTRLEEMVEAAYPELSKNQRKVADYIMQNMNEAAFLSVIEIGEQCGASKATVVRFAQSIGFEGFIEFRNAIHAAVHHQFQYLERFPLEAEANNKTIFEVAQQEVKNINQTMESIVLDDFNRAIEMMQHSKTIYTYGMGISALMAKVLAYSLNQVAIKSYAMVSDHLTKEEQMMFLQPDDLLMLFSFPPYSNSTIEAANEARKRGIPVIAFTDKRVAPVVSEANVSLFIQSENMLFTNSFAAISVLINAITTEISIRNKEKTLSFIKEVNDKMKSTNHFF